MPKPDLLIVNPGGRRRIYQELADELSAIEPPIWAGLLATFARRRGLEVEILDANALELTHDETAERVVSRGAVLTVVVVYGHNPSASTQVMPAAGAVCRATKDRAPEQKLMLLGGHVAALPERTLRDEAADYVCDGEGPYTIVELVDALRNGTSVADVRGLAHLDDGRFRQNAPAPLVTDLDREMPGIAWDLLPMQRYRAHNWHCFGGLDRQPYAAIYTTLGCPFKCSFCCIQAPFRRGESALGYKPGANSYRRWGAAAVAAEIDVLVQRFGVRNLKIADELFLVDKSHVLAVCDELIERDYDLNIWAYARVDTVGQPGVLEKLRAAGVRWLALGIESASERVLDDVDKGYSENKIFEAVRKIQDAGIHIVGNYIFGLPEDDHASMQQTLDLAIELGTEYGNFYCAMAYPGSELYKTALDRGWRLPASWDGYSQHSRSSLPLPTRSLTAGEVLAFRDAAFDRYFAEGSYRERLVAKFGPRALTEVDAMCAKRLVRNHVVQAT